LKLQVVGTSKNGGVEELWDYAKFVVAYHGEKIM